ncbi:hypothetical protein D3C81_1353250 [compost metagenome]
MGADAHPFFLGAPYHAAHGERVTRMEAASDIGGTDDFQDGVVIADVVGAEALAHVRVQVDRDCHCSFSSFDSCVFTQKPAGGRGGRVVAVELSIRF